MPFAQTLFDLLWNRHRVLSAKPRVKLGNYTVLFGKRKQRAPVWSFGKQCAQAFHLRSGRTAFEQQRPLDFQELISEWRNLHVGTPRNLRQVYARKGSISARIAVGDFPRPAKRVFHARKR